MTYYTRHAKDKSLKGVRTSVPLVLPGVSNEAIKASQERRAQKRANYKAAANMPTRSAKAGR